MKKLIIAALTLFGASAAGFAQAVTAAKANTRTANQIVKTLKTKQPAAKAASMNRPAKPSAATAAGNTSMTAKPTTTVHLKADGTPDKRFKSKSTTAGPLKKDGTPDMRYKVNKKKV